MHALFSACQRYTMTPACDMQIAAPLVVTLIGGHAMAVSYARWLSCFLDLFCSSLHNDTSM